ncbi:MAG: Flp pilus assembly protein TadD [Oceanicoccus sp.]
MVNLGAPKHKTVVGHDMKRTLKNHTPFNRVRLFLIHCVVYLMACSVVQQEPVQFDAPVFSVRYDTPFSSRPDIAGVEEIHQLSFSQQQHFLSYFHDYRRRKVPSHERVANYLENFVDEFRYRNETYSAAQTLALSQGNCLSLAILTTALANLANIEVGYQLADSIPVFSFSDNVVFKGVHIRSKLYDPTFSPEDGRLYMSRPGLRIDYFPSGSERFIRNVSKNEYVARYYLNLAALAILKNEYSRAYWLTVESLDFAPRNSDAYNSLGIIYRRVGETAKAEEIYRYGIDKLAGKLSLLKNYRTLLALQNRDDEVKLITEKINAIDDPNPFGLILAGKESYDEGQYIDAIKFYRRALEMAPYIHEARLALAQSYYQTGQFSKAQMQMQTAIESAQDSSARRLYQAKLMSLNSKID